MQPTTAMASGATPDSQADSTASAMPNAMQAAPMSARNHWTRLVARPVQNIWLGVVSPWRCLTDKRLLPFRCAGTSSRSVLGRPGVPAGQRAVRPLQEPPSS